MEFFAQRPAVVPQIYAYTLPDVTTHQGYIKVGYTEREDVNERIREQLHTSAVTLQAAVYRFGYALRRHLLHRP